MSGHFRLCRSAFRKLFLPCVAVALIFQGIAWAGIFGTVRGIVHDAQHRPIENATVVLQAKRSDWKKEAATDGEGRFQMDAVPAGLYTIHIVRDRFRDVKADLTVLPDSAPLLHFPMELAPVHQSVEVSDSAQPVDAGFSTASATLTREDIQATPGASRTNSLEFITAYTPGAYMVHDQLHIRGGHQVSWLIDGVPVPNTNITSNVGPQFDPKDMDVVEIQRGGYSADYGDRTYGVFNVAPRTGFERNDEAEVVFGLGNFYQTDDQINFGSHNNRFAYYASANGNRTDLGLQTPTSAVIHDRANGFGGFASLIYNASSQDQLRFVTSLRRDYYQIPFDPADPNDSLGEFLRDANRERDAFLTFSWVRTFTPGLVLTVSPFYHFNSADYVSSPNDTPTAATQTHSSKYEGGQATLAYIQGRNNARAGLYGFAQQDTQLFDLLFNDGSGTSPLRDTENLSGALTALYLEDQFRATSWFTLNAGIRQTHFSGSVVENSTSPRFGAALRVPKLNWVFRAFYGHFYQAPPLATLTGPSLQQVITNQGFVFTPLHGERDEESQFGVNIPLKAWTIDADTFRTRATNYFDHNNLNNSDIFFPVTVNGALTRGWELTLRSPRIKNRGQLYLTYSNQLAQGRGCIQGGLIPPCDIPASELFSLDHDQRNTLHIGGNLSLPWHSFASTDVYYASGFSNGAPPPSHLPGYTTFDISLGKNFAERLSLSINTLNVANRRVLLDNSFTFGGTHLLNPREIFFQLRYRFHY